jgi:hypothetical protein
LENLSSGEFVEQTQEEVAPGNMSPFDLGAWVGKSQAFAIFANRATAAQAESLRRIHESRAYDSLGISWEEFCERHVGISSSYAYKLIQRLAEFGPAYFKLTQLARISPESYRAISPAVSAEGIEIDGALVPFTPENAENIRQAIHRLQSEARPVCKAKAPSLNRLRKRLEACFEEISQLLESPRLAEVQVPVDGLLVYCCKHADLLYTRFMHKRPTEVFEEDDA